MTREQSTPTNPNHYVGCYPINLSDSLNSLFGEANNNNQIPFHRFDHASFYNGAICWQLPSARRKVLDRLIKQLVESDLPGTGHVIRYFQDMYRRNCKAKTIKTAATAIILFLNYLKRKAVVDVEHIGRHDIEAFVEQEQERGLKITSVRTRLHALYAFIRFLSNDDLVDPQLLLRKVKLKMPQRLPRAIALEDIIKLVSVIDDVRDRAMILLLLRTGMRIGELLKLQVNDVDLEARLVKIYEGEKNYIGRVVYFSDDAREALIGWLKQRNRHKSHLFYSQGRSCFTYNGARMMFVKYLRRAGLEHKGYTLHCLRHSFATELLNAGMRIECLQQLLGHSKLEVTRIYARLSDKARESEYFRAMAIIEGESSDGFDQHDY
jgi:site-specific recombinase XerD